MTDLDAIIPRTKVMEVVLSFLEECGFQLEIDAKIVAIPRSIELALWTRAFIKQDEADVFLGDHYEAVVMLGGREEPKANWLTEFGYLRLYFTSEGKFRHRRQIWT